jgi:general secretion pathway protein L
MPKLFIRLLSPAVITDDGYRLTSEWMIQEDDGRTRGHGRTDFRGLSELIDPGADWLQTPGNVIVTVPSEYVLSLSCDVPGRSVGQIRRALPFVVEEFVTTDIDAMHLASGEIRRGSPTPVILIDRTLLEDWLGCLEALQVRADYLFADADLLPVAAGQATLLLDDQRVLVRTPDQAAALDRENLTLAVSALQVERVQVVHGVLTDLELGELSQDLEVKHAPGVETGSVLEYVAANWHSTAPLNLLQGDFKPRQPVNPLWMRWRSVAALAAVWVGVALLAMTAEGIYAGYRADQLEAASIDLYRDIFPAETRVINARRQLQAKLGERPDDAGATILGFLGPLAAAQTPATRLQSLNYTGERGELAVDLIIDGFEALDRLKDSLAGEGVAVEITSAEQTDSGVRARIRLSDQRAG